MTEPFEFARRTDWELASNRLTACLDELRKKNIPVIDLTESNPTRCGFQYPDTEILTALSALQNMTYAPSAQGILQAREAVSAYYGEKGLKLDPSRILLTSSTSEAYSFLFRLLVNPGEQILVPRPSYPLFQFLVELNDAQIGFYSLNYDGRGWHIDMEALKLSILPETRAIVLVNPNNPTGSFIRPEELAELNGICRKNNIALICDEVFLDYAFDGGQNVLSLAGNNEALTFVLGGISKCLGLPQMKVAWITASGPQSQVDGAMGRLDVIADTYLSVSTPAQNSLSGWLDLRAGIQKEILARLKTNRASLVKDLAGTGFELLSSDGGWYSIIKLPEHLEEEEWALELLEKDQVFVHPGYFFDFEEDGHAVVSLLPPADVFKEGLVRILKRSKAGAGSR